MKQKLSMIAKTRLQQGSRGANSVATISESAYEIYFVLARSKRIPFGVKASECLLPVDGCHEKDIKMTRMCYSTTRSFYYLHYYYHYQRPLRHVLAQNDKVQAKASPRI